MESDNKLAWEPLIQDEFTGEPPTKRTLAYIQSKRELDRPVVGTYCGYAPLEIFRALDTVPAVLCAFSDKTIAAAEAVLPANLCPLIKSSYGFIITDTCPFFAVSDAVVAETTCDGKKKMFELIADYKPLFVMDLPQIPCDADAHASWTRMIHKLKAFLEKTFARATDNARIEMEIKDTNRKNALMRRIFAYAALTPPLITWQEVYDLTYLAQPASAADIAPLLEACIAKLEQRRQDGQAAASPTAPRVLVTGCPVGGDATKVFKVIDEAGGVIVGLDSCTGMKPFQDDIAEDTGDPVAALAARYLKLPCACMSPNGRRLESLDNLIAHYQPDAVIEVILHACHGYNVEAYKVREHVKTRHNLPYLKIETDYSQGDVKQIKTRVEALFETI